MRNYLGGAALVLLVAAGCASTSATIQSDDGGGEAPAAATCSPVETFDDLGREHISEDTEVDSYNSEPPTSGPHFATPADPGFYTTSPPAEQLVHNLEHGQVVIHYSPDAPDDQLTTLQELIRDDPISLLVVPNEAATGPDEIILAAWTALQRCDGFSETDVNSFRTTFQGQGPENVGVPTFEDPST